MAFSELARKRWKANAERRIRKSNPLLIHHGNNITVVSTSGENRWALTDQYITGRKPGNFPVPAVHCKVVWFPEGHWISGFNPYINVLGYNGKQGLYAPGYYVIHKWEIPCTTTITS